MGDLFEKLNLKFLKSIFDKDKDISKEKNEEFDLPLVNAKNWDNWIMYYWRSKDFQIAEMTIDIVNDWAVSTWNVYSQPQKTWVLYNAYLIKPQFNITEKILHFFTSTIQKSIKLKYGYENKAGWEKVKHEEIQLPIKNWKIDFEFMEEFIAELEALHIAELEAYLLATWLKDYILTTEEEKVLADFENGKFDWGEFRLGDLFEINSYKKRFDANKTKISESFWNPYVVRTSLNNWIRGYISEDENFLNDQNTISFWQDTATMFYQEKPYFTWDKIKILKSKNENFKKSNSQFFITTMTKSFSIFTWGSSSFSVWIIEKQEIFLPIKNNSPDYKLMEILISAIQKLVIKDVVLYTDKKIEATKEAIKN